MARIGTVIGFLIAPNMDGDKPSMLLQTEITEITDIQEVELFRSSGEDYNPPVNANVIILNLSDAWPVAIACDDGVLPETLPGEKILYSTDGNIKLNKLHFKIDGTIDILGLGYAHGISIKPDLSVTIFNVLGKIELLPTGQVNINDNFTVDP